MTTRSSEGCMVSTTLSAVVTMMRLVGRRMIPTECTFNFDLDMPGGMDKEKQINALAKMKTWLSVMVEDCIALEAAKSQDLSWIAHIDNRIMFCPAEPNDILIQVLVHSKLNAIGQGYVEVINTHMTTDHSQGIGMSFEGDVNELLPKQRDWMGERCYYPAPWWHRSDASMIDVIAGPEDDISKKPDILMEWGTLLPEGTVSGSEPAEIIRPNFKPRIITND
jgi:hypothetical protein